MLTLQQPQVRFVAQPLLPGAPGAAGGQLVVDVRAGNLVRRVGRTSSHRGFASVRRLLVWNLC
ncbi:hypothetical protein GCM10017559_74410 [Streptosporangium longisporum]|uniref:Uncharacterized protein n=1 Tax=Streptosporangium longisporum TaxID=46187 RepID=A0ABP6L8I4_9ACTN